MFESQITLTGAQAALRDTIINAWRELAVPTVVHVASPGYRGKTQVVQSFYETLAYEAFEGSASTAPIKPSWQEFSDWRARRKQVKASSIVSATSGMTLWLGVNATAGFTDLLSPLRETTQEILRRAEENSLPAATMELIKPMLAARLGKIAVTAAGKLALDRIPFFSTGEIIASGISEATHAWQSSKRPTGVLREAVERPVDREAVAMLALMRLSGDIAEPPALPGIILMIENAELLGDGEFTMLSLLLSANPDDILTQRFLPASVYKAFKVHGVPPRLPILVILLETTDSSRESYRGPFGEMHERDTANTLICDPWIDRWRDSGIDVFCSINRLPLFTEHESQEVLERLSPTVSQHVRNVMAARAFDSLLDGYSPALLRSHAERVMKLMDPEETVTSDWAVAHLPMHLNVELELVAAQLKKDSQMAVIAGSLLGVGFAASSVQETLGYDPVNALILTEKLGLVHHEDAEDDTFFLFDDSMVRDYFYELGASDGILAWHVLDVHDALKVNYLLDCAVPFHTQDSRAIASLVRQSLWEYRSLMLKAGLASRWDSHRDIWLASLTLSGDMDIVMREAGDQDARDRLKKLWDEGDSGPKQGENLKAWSIITRWLGHRLIPGPMTYQMLFNAAKAGRFRDQLIGQIRRRTGERGACLVDEFSYRIQEVCTAGLRFN